ncbi:hypothetical protein D3C85_848710 [compost metagenome]
MQYAVDPEADPVLGLIGFEMQVGCATLDGIHHDFMDVFDYGGIVVGSIDALVEARTLIGHLELRDLGLVDVIHAQGVLLGVHQLAEGGGELALLDQQGFRVQAEAEAEILQGRHIGRVRHGDIEGVALGVDGQHMVFLNQLLIEVFLRDLGQIEGGKIQQRYPILQLAEIRQRLAVEDVVLDQEGDKGLALRPGLAQIAL